MESMEISNLLTNSWFVMIADDGDAQEHPAGNYQYTFSYHLDKNAPSSFEGQYGSVRYVATATIDKPWKFDHEAKLAFTVINSLDLNTEPASIRVSELGLHAQIIHNYMLDWCTIQC